MEGSTCAMEKIITGIRDWVMNGKYHGISERRIVAEKGGGRVALSGNA